MKWIVAFILLSLSAVTRAQTIEYVHTDPLGSPVAITNQAGQVIERMQYEPYGASIGQGNSDRPGYTGHVMDSQSGLTYMQQRYMDPQIGQFLSVDPVTADSASGGNFNRLWYASNNPYGFTDPDGRLVQDGRPNPFDDFQPNQGFRSLPCRGAPVCLASGTSDTPKIPSSRVDLRNQEGINGGHTISEHVGKSDAFLLNRMNQTISIGPVDIYKAEHSTFSSLESANRLVSSTISSNQPKIADWLASPLGRFRPLILNQSFGSITGRAALREGRGYFSKPGSVNFASTRGVRVVLKLSSSSPTGYTVLTAFPTR